MSQQTQNDFDRLLEEEALRALKRAAHDAHILSRQTKTPFYIYRDGKVVDLNAPKPRKAKEVKS